jgi:hypothetical protein
MRRSLEFAFLMGNPIHTLNPMKMEMGMGKKSP